MNSISLYTSTYGCTGAVVPSPRITDELTRLSVLISLSLFFFFKFLFSFSFFNIVNILSSHGTNLLFLYSNSQSEKL